MQHIGLRREKEDGEVEAIYADGDSIDLRIVAAAPARSCCLRFIDPYGDTIFNQLQIPVLIEELTELALNTKEPIYVDDVVEFLKDSIDNHTHVRFEGD